MCAKTNINRSCTLISHISSSILFYASFLPSFGRAMLCSPDPSVLSTWPLCCFHLTPQFFSPDPGWQGLLQERVSVFEHLKKEMQILGKAHGMLGKLPNADVVSIDLCIWLVLKILWSLIFGDFGTMFCLHMWMKTCKWVCMSFH